MYDSGDDAKHTVWRYANHFLGLIPLADHDQLMEALCDLNLAFVAWSETQEVRNAV